MNATTRQSRVELPREETRRRQQNLVRSFQLINLTAQLLDLGDLRRGLPRPSTGVNLGLLSPGPQRVRVHPNPWTNPVNGLIQRQTLLLLPGLEHETDRSIPQLLRILPWCWQLHLSVKSMPPQHPGRFKVVHPPRLWLEYHPNYYGGFVRDPDGNNVEAVCHLSE